MGANSYSGYDFYWSYDGSFFNRTSSWWSSGSVFIIIFFIFEINFIKIKGNPNFTLGNEYCMKMYNTSGKLIDAPCESNNLVPLCKTSVNSWSQNLTRVQPTVASCPIGWSNYSSHCYFIGNSLMTYHVAQAYCNSQYKGAFLAELTSQAEFNWTVSLINS